MAMYVPRGRLCGIDFGTVRVGIALSDARQTLASPYATYARRDAARDAEYFRRLAAEEQVAEFVVGLPVHGDGSEGAKAAEARRFGAWLSETTGLPVNYFDERFTSQEADAFLAQGKLTRLRRKERRDQLAAQILLTAYLESKDRGSAPPGALDG